MAQEQAEDNGRLDGDAIELTGWLRPAQAGVALAGTARPAHIAATLVDLEIRGYLTIEQTTDGEGGVDWGAGPPRRKGWPEAGMVRLRRCGGAVRESVAVRLASSAGHPVVGGEPARTTRPTRNRRMSMATPT